MINWDLCLAPVLVFNYLTKIMATGTTISFARDSHGHKPVRKYYLDDNVLLAFQPLSIAELKGVSLWSSVSVGAVRVDWCKW